MIYAVDSDFPGFSRIPLNSGVNIILAERMNNSTNSVGKTLFLECINYVLGADYSRSELSKYPELFGYKISLEMDYKGEKGTFSRIISKDNNNKIFAANGKIIKLSGWKEGLLKSNFNLDSNSSILSWRNLFHFFYKISFENSFEKALKSFNGEPEYKTSLYQSFLLDIAFKEFKDLAETSVLTSERKGFNKYLNTLKKTLETIPEIFPEKDINYSKINDEINKKINILKVEIRNLQSSLDIVSSKINQLIENKKVLLNIKSADDLGILYSSLEQELGDYVKKTFEEADAFHKSLVEENIEIITEEVNKLKVDKSRLVEQRDDKQFKLRYLLENKFEEERNISHININDLVLNHLISGGGNSIAAKIGKKIKVIEENTPDKIIHIIDKNADTIERYSTFLKGIVNSIYESDKNVEFSIEYSDALDVIFSYDDDSGTGKGNMKVLIYYMFILLLNHSKLSRGIDFLILDTDITDGIDSNNLFKFFEIVEKHFSKYNIQLISTLRADRDTSIDNTEYQYWIKHRLYDSENGFLFKSNLKKRKK